MLRFYRDEGLMSVRQLQVANDNVQDRLVLRVATGNNEEIRIFLTRRFLREIWPHLSRILSTQLTTPEAPASSAPPGGQASFEEPFKEDNPTYPLGMTPLLASEATFETPGQNQLRLILREGKERSFTLLLNTELLQALCSMLRAASEKAKWDLGLNYEISTPALTATPGKSLLH